MPIFEYHCHKCLKTFEKIQKKPQQEIVCPACGAMAQRAVSAPSAGAGSACSAPPGSGFT